jgi:uncharacterized protein
MRQIFNITIFIFLFSIIGNAQQIPDYLFLEVLDSNGKPIEGATVINSPDGFSSRERKQLTDDKGGVKFYLPSDPYNRQLNSYFTVIKENHFTYYDLGGSGYSHQSNVKIELLKIPNSESEKQNLGNEQIKREFMWAVKTGDAETVKKLLKTGISPNLTTSDLRGVAGRKDVPAILFAAFSADSETVETLIKAGVNIRRKEEPYRSILNTYLSADPFAWHKYKTETERKEILNRYQDGVGILLKAGADFNVEDSNNQKPIMIAANKGYTQVVEMLLNKGFSPNYADKNGQTLLMAATRNEYSKSKYSKVETVNFLLKKGADPNLSINDCWSPLYGAASGGDNQSIQVLVKYGAKLDTPCDKSYSPLISAVESRQVESAKLLIELGANIKPDRNGTTALMYAAKTGNTKMIQMLIDKGISVNTKQKDGWTALATALNSNDDIETIKTLLNAGANANDIINSEVSEDCSSPLISSVRNRYYNLIKVLIEYKAEVNLTCSNGKTALAYAIYGRNPEIVKLLIEIGANPNGKEIDKALSEIITYYKEGDYYRKYVDETIKIVEEARAKEKKPNN